MGANVEFPRRGRRPTQGTKEGVSSGLSPNIEDRRGPPRQEAVHRMLGYWLERYRQPKPGDLRRRRIPEGEDRRDMRQRAAYEAGREPRRMEREGRR